MGVGVDFWGWGKEENTGEEWGKSVGGGEERIEENRVGNWEECVDWGGEGFGV